MPSEKQFQAQVIRAAKTRGWSCYWTWSSIHSPAGWPDLVLLHPADGRALFRELKTDKGRLTPSQKECLGELECAGLDAAVWRPADWDAIMRELGYDVID